MWEKPPILEVAQYKIKQRRGTTQILSAGEAAELMKWLEPYRGKTEQGRALVG